MGYPLINAILDNGQTLRFSVKGHRYKISPLWDDDFRFDPFGSNSPTGYCFTDIDLKEHKFYRHLSGCNHLLDLPLEGGLTLRENYSEIEFEPLIDELDAYR